jgi:hypothetical protein
VHSGFTRTAEKGLILFLRAAAREPGYLGPDPKGRLLRAGKFNAIGVMPPSDWGVVDSLRNPVFDLFLLGVGEVCDEIGANLLIVPGRTGDGGIKTALVDGFIFGRVEHLAQIEPAIFPMLNAAVRHSPRSMHWQSKKGAPLRELSSRADGRAMKY